MNVFLDAALNSSNRFEQKHSAFVANATEGNLCSCYRVVRFTGDRQEKEESNRQLDLLQNIFWPHSIVMANYRTPQHLVWSADFCNRSELRNIMR